MAIKRIGRLEVATGLWAELVSEQAFQRTGGQHDVGDEDGVAKLRLKASDLQEGLRQSLDPSLQTGRLPISTLVDIASQWMSWISRGVSISVEQIAFHAPPGTLQFRFIVWRSQLPRRIKTIVGSSRSHQDPTLSDWHARLRSIFWQKECEPGSRWLFAEGTAVASVAARLAQCYGQPWSLLDVSRANHNHWRWWQRVLNEYPRASIHAAWVSPPVSLVQGETLSAEPLDRRVIPAVPLSKPTRGWIDRLLIEWSDAIWVLSARSHGAIETAIKSRLKAELGKQVPRAAWHLPVDFQDTLYSMRENWRDAKKSFYVVPRPAGWAAQKEATRNNTKGDNTKPGTRGISSSFRSIPAYAISLARPCPLATLELSCEGLQSNVISSTKNSSHHSRQAARCCSTWSISTTPPAPFLFHWTRANSGKWPDQTMAEYLDDQLWRGSVGKRDALATLQRIIRMRRIIGTFKLTRGWVPRVSFTERTPRQLVKKRVFRRHLRRWDAEPYGIGIRTSVLQSLGAQPVIYGPAGVSATLTQDQQLFFQPVSERRSDRSRDEVRWEDEREWRILGNVNLELIDPNSIFVLVANEEERRSIQTESPWPIYAGELLR